ncbi:MAG: Leucyl aminopeptidase, partial [Thermoleophilia bacterium]|nr:Leucyl aminopeptidase [Thermoleophilia bacterium]
AARRAHEVALAQNWARDLANAPANLLMPEVLAETARTMAGEFEHLSFRSFDRAEIEAAGMGMFAAVAQGSADEPRMIVLEWNPPGAPEGDDERLALVGKAVVFDTGGISIKPSGGMEDMKLDKAGGCAVLGAMRAIAATNVPHRVIAVVGATTNMPDGNAYRPGDVVTAMDGTTVEIISTDAEGRLVLGDCISFVRGEGCGAIVEASTLTGAMVIALGHRYTGAIAKKTPLLDAVVAAGEATGDHAWHLPMHDEYRANLKADCADFKNSGSRDAGALSAGSFLGHFAKDTPFVHLDVAGTAMLAKPRMWYGCKGASGWGVRLMTELAGRFPG